MVDLGLPDRSGLDLIKDIRMQTKAPIVVFTMYDDPSYALRALKAGASGYISKHAPVFCCCCVIGPGCRRKRI